MAVSLRFELYKLILSLVQQQDFRGQKVFPLELPGREKIEVELIAPELPRLYRARNFPATEHAAARYNRIRVSGPLLRVLSLLPPRRTAPIATDLEGFLRQIYPQRYRKLCPHHPPALPPDLGASQDLLASLAVRGPFARYLRKASADGGATSSGGFVHDGDYLIDMSPFEDYPAKPGLVPPGGTAVYGVDGDRLVTRGIVYQGKFIPPEEAAFRRVSRAFLCALNTHLTTLLHNVTIHLAYVTPMNVVTSNQLGPEHPVRRLLHFAFQTTLVGNFEVATFQIVGPNGYATRLFSYDYPTLVRIINRHLDHFRIADLDPEHDVERRGVASTPFAQPHRDNVLDLWRVTRDFVGNYLDLYYPDDRAVAADLELAGWRGELDRLLPGGLEDDAGYVAPGPLTLATLKRICATFLHTSMVTHDQVNNVVWDYSTLNFLIPTVVPESGEQQDQRLSFDFMTTLVGTWKEFNMLFDGISLLGLDAPARDLMDRYVARMREMQGILEVADGPNRPDLTYPRNLNYSISN